MDRKRIVFIGHISNLSGAPILLLNLIALLKKHGEADMELVVARGGPLVTKYGELTTVLVLKPEGYGKGNPFKRFREIVRNRLDMRRFRAMVRKADLVISNTVVNGDLIQAVLGTGKPVITYAHELEAVVADYLKMGLANASVYDARRVAYPSLAVRDSLIHKFNVPAEVLMPLAYYFPVDEKLLSNESAIREHRAGLRRRFNIGDHDMLIGGMGVASYRKGTDIFLRVAAAVMAANPRIQFRWIGNFEHAQAEEELDAVLAETGLQKAAIFTGPLAHHYYNTAAFDLLFLSSREDPYPLVVLEAAFMQVPAICYEGAGGMPEFVQDDAGWLIPGFSVDAAAQSILRLYDQQEAIAAKGACARQKALQLHASDEVILQQFRALTSLQ
ncbi:glycosyltransferase family 4 protein [Chitinophaga horti]|uniref:Glycosyltransferase family 4 protein n=1 Tax=Chitinophaga horti TaxID=2920382 RepID=A0ABY6J898_9BACT|nr:glycosyltransferase family 4 protein [Chitinophaga horti]UYQ95899.1 glycosyltransferase family 4 protein [Chitinophaga horti]